MGSGDMSPNTAQRLAALIVAGAEQLQEKAQQHGVTAFCNRPVQREKPNERFLQNTLKNLASANRRADEKVMWAAWEAQRQLDGGSGGHRGPARREGSGDRRGAGYSSASTERDREREMEKGRCANGGGGRGSEWQGTGSRSKKRSRSSEQHRRRPSRSGSRSRGINPGESADLNDRSRHKKQRQRRGSHDVSGGEDEVSTGGGSSCSDHDASPLAGVAATGTPSRQLRSSPGSSSREHDADAAEAEMPDRLQEESVEQHSADEDQQLLQWLASSKAVRGRGSLGPSADLPGPFLEPPAGVNRSQLQELEQGLVRGPERPAWMQRDTGVGGRLVPNAGFLRGILRAQGIVAAEQLQPEQRKDGRRVGAGSIDSSSESSSSSGSDSERKWRKSSKRSRKHKHKQKRSRKDKKQKREKHKRKRQKE